MGKKEKLKISMIIPKQKTAMDMNSDDLTCDVRLEFVIGNS